MTRRRNETYVAREFNRAAKGYDDSRVVRSFQRRTQALVLEELQIEPGMNVLDLGCGTGWATLEIAARLEGTGKVVGLDLSERMIEQAKQKLTGFRYQNVVFTLQSASSMDYDDHFDLVLSTNAFHHFVDKGEVFSRVWRALKRDGSFLVQDICDDFVLMKALDFIGKVGERAHVGSTTVGELKELFLSAGFANVKAKTLKLNWFWAIMIGTGVKRDKEA